jgi:hypothetical protein
MWLKRLVGLAMILALLGMNGLVFAGLFTKPKNSEQTSGVSLGTTALIAAPTITISVDPVSIPAGTTSAIKWTTTGDPTSCTASGSWDGDKTLFGAESTGRVSDQGKRTYTLTCKNAGGSAQAAAELTVGPPNSVPVASKPAANGGSTSTTPTYCGGRIPCYGAKDVGAHGSAGNCWGWNSDRVINISGFDAAFHQAKSGISSIEVSGVCGKDLGPSLGGSVSAGGQTRNHNSATKANADRNEIPYFVGYFDTSK